MNGKKIYVKEEFDSLFTKWSKKVYAYAYHKTRSEYLAEETVQCVFIKLWKYRELEDDAVAMETRIFCIARSTLVDLLRKEAYRRRELDIPFNYQYVASPSAIYAAKELQSQLYLKIEELPPVRKQVFKLSRFENLSHKEIASKLAISPKTVENHINLALRSLKKFLFLFFIFLF